MDSWPIGLVRRDVKSDPNATYRQRDSRDQCTEKTSPHGLDTEHTAHFLGSSSSNREASAVDTFTDLDREQHSTNGGTKGNGNSCSTGGRQNLSHFH